MKIIRTITYLNFLFLVIIHFIGKIVNYYVYEWGFMTLGVYLATLMILIFIVYLIRGKSKGLKNIMPFLLNIITLLSVLSYIRTRLYF